jgi:hypothetical protein
MSLLLHTYYIVGYEGVLGRPRRYQIQGARAGRGEAAELARV